jgi:hypothetical protein
VAPLAFIGELNIQRRTPGEGHAACGRTGRERGGYCAPTELGEFFGDGFYKYFAPLELGIGGCRRKTDLFGTCALSNVLSGQVNIGVLSTRHDVLSSLSKIDGVNMPLLRSLEIFFGDDFYKYFAPLELGD